MLLSSISQYVGLTIDIVIVITLLCFAIIGYKKGFLNSVIALFSTIVVLGLAVAFANNFAKLLNSIYDFTELIAKKITPSIEKIDNIYKTTFPEGMSGKEFYSQYISSSGTNTIVKKFFEYALKGFSAESVAGLKVSEVLAGSVASIIMTIISGILLFILIKIALNLLSRFFDNISSSKIFGGVNKLFGFVFGAVKGTVLIIFVALLTIAVSFVPKANKKIYPLIQNETNVAKMVYNTTDRYVEKFVIKSNVITKWINNLWDNRNLTPTKPIPVEDRAEVLANDFAKTEQADCDIYTKTYDNMKSTESANYYRLNKIDGLTNQNVVLEISLTYNSSDVIAFDLFGLDNVDTPVQKSSGGNAMTFIYDNVGYVDYLLKLSSHEEIITSITITIIAEKI